MMIEGFDTIPTVLSVHQPVLEQWPPKRRLSRGTTSGKLA